MGNVYLLSGENKAQAGNWRQGFVAEKRPYAEGTFVRANNR